MNDLPIMFFQVAASAIPTLLIAVAVGIKQGATYAKQYGQLAARGFKFKAMVLGITVAIGLAIAMGEFAALRAIARGSGNSAEVELVFTAIFICFLLIVLEMLAPFAESMTPQNHIRLLTGVSGIWVLFAGYYLLISNGIIPL
jgi:hypothetical protein